MECRTAFVTGASSGIGFGLARRLARRGVEVGLAARREEQLKELEELILRDGGRARVYVLDVADTEHTVATLRRADDEMGGLDLVVANAGVGSVRPSDELAWADCEPILRVNVAGALATLTALIDRMVSRRRGHLVGVSSLAQVRGIPANAAYCASKACLSTFLEAMRVDLKPAGIYVTDVRPGFVDTPLSRQSPLPTPYVMDVECAVDHILRGIERHHRIVAFPWQLAVAANAARLLPGAIYDALAEKVRRWPQERRR